jgi:hypothetical protein
VILRELVNHPAIEQRFQAVNDIRLLQRAYKPAIVGLASPRMRFSGLPLYTASQGKRLTSGQI